MADSVDRVFVHALNTVKKLPRSGTSRPPPEDRLKLYGLYKQSMEGDVDGVMPRPTGTSDEELTEARKWDSWNEQRGISKTEAKRRYITTLIDAMHRFATTTPEARELVSELEFVWDQIKSNQSSSSSSPPQVLYKSSSTPIRPSSSLSHQQNISSVGLQILPPMSPTEEEHAAKFQNFPPVGMGVQTDDDEGDDEDEHYQTMDEFDENGLPKVTVISEPVTLQAKSSGTQDRNIGGQESQLKKKLVISSASSHISGQTSKKASTSSQHPDRQNSNLNPNYSRWKHRVEAALTKMTAEVAALREQLDVARAGAGETIVRGRFGWLRRFIAWGVWTALKHLVIDAIVLTAIVIWMRKKGDRRLEGVLNLIGGFLSEKLRIRKPARGSGSDARTFVVA